MRFSAAAVLAFASAVLAQTDGFNVITKPTDSEKVPAGSTYEVVWQPGPEKYAGPITIDLVGGPSQQGLQKIENLATGYDGTTGKFSWPVDKSLGKEKIYGIQIFWEQDARVFQWSFPFQIAGDGSALPTKSSNATFPPKTSSTSNVTSVTNLPGTTVIISTPTGFTTVPSTTASTPTGVTSAPPTVTNGAGSSAGSTLALFGGLAMAIFAL